MTLKEALRSFKFNVSISKNRDNFVISYINNKTLEFVIYHIQYDHNYQQVISFEKLIKDKIIIKIDNHYEDDFKFTELIQSALISMLSDIMHICEKK